MSVFAPVNVSAGAVRAALKNHWADEADESSGRTGQFSAAWPDPADIDGISDHQRAELGKAMTGRVGMFSGGPGCISGETLIRYQRGNRKCGRMIPLKNLYLKFNNLPVSGKYCGSAWDNKTPTLIQSIDTETGRVFYNRIINVISSGLKRCLRVTLDSGESYLVTPDHPVLTQEGFTRADGLVIGQSVVCRGQMVPTKKSDRKKKAKRVVVEGLKYYSSGSLKKVKEPSSGVVYLYKRQNRSRLVLEATLNEMSYEKYVYALKNDPLAVSLKTLPRGADVHHINENALDDVPDNLEVLSKADHTRKHNPVDKFSMDYTRVQRVVSVVPDGVHETFDIQMASPAHNFALNDGLFVHNCGKSHTTAALIRTVVRLHPGAVVRCVAPTGKAAQRLSELMVAAGLNLRASTIHTALQPQRNGHDGAGWGFFHDESNPLYCHLLICDESSMVDAGLMRSLISAVSPETLVLFVGDPDQLPPVGKGRPFADAIEAGMPHGHLTEIHRFAGRIARVCGQIVRGEHWTPSAKLDLEAAEFPENMRHIEVGAAKLGEQLEDLLHRIKGRGFDLMNDVQILTATNDQREKLNISLQAYLNPDGDKIGECPYRLGDKAICLRNQWISRDWVGKFKPRGLEQLYVANGEIGFVTRIDKGSVAVDFGNGPLRFDKAAWKDTALAYAVTVWKAQGSQWPVVITLAEDSRGADMICDRAFWYTAISRAGKVSFTLGKRSAIDRQCARAGLHQRRTFLTRKIQEWLSPPEPDQPDQPSQREEDFTDV